MNDVDWILRKIWVAGFYKFFFGALAFVTWGFDLYFIISTPIGWERVFGIALFGFIFYWLGLEAAKKRDDWRRELDRYSGTFPK